MTAQLTHPNTVAIYDYGRTPDGVFYYAMEYLDGINLEDLVRAARSAAAGPGGGDPRSGVRRAGGGAWPRPRPSRHQARQHHPDRARGRARRRQGGGLRPRQAARGRRVRGADLSAAGALTGTPLYLSPEAMTMPEGADPRSDLYALGAVAYFLLTGTSGVRGGDRRRDPRPSSSHRAGGAVAPCGAAHPLRPRGARDAVPAQASGGPARKRPRAPRRAALVHDGPAVDERRGRGVVADLPVFGEARRAAASRMTVTGSP